MIRNGLVRIHESNHRSDPVLHKMKKEKKQ